MALVLGVRLGDCIDIGPNWIRAWSVYNRSTLIVLTSDGRMEKISSRRIRQIFDGVEIGLGPHPTSQRLKLIICADPSTPITRRLQSKDAG